MTSRMKLAARPLPWVACALLGGLLVAAGDPHELPLGRRLDVKLPAATAGDDGGATQAFTLMPDADGPLTVQARSVDGDVLLRQLDEHGDVLAEDDDGGIVWNARLVIEHARAGEALRLLLVMKRAEGGAATLEAQPGVIALPEGPALNEARGLFLAARGQRQLDQGFAAPAASDLGAAGNMLFAAQRFTDARDVFATLIPLLEQQGDTQRATYARGFHACCVARLGALEQALPLLEDAAAQAGQVGAKPLEMMVVSDLGTVCKSLGLLAQAEQHTTRALELARDIGDRGNEVNLLTQLARLQIAQRRTDDALAASEACDALAESLGIPPLQLEALCLRAAVDVSRGDRNSARKAYELALALPSTTWRRIGVLGELGDVDMSLGNTLSAADHYREAARLATSINDPALLATATIGLGFTQLASGDPSRARDAFGAALASLGDAGDPSNRATALMLLSHAEIELGKRDEARRHSEEARRVAQSVEDRVLESRAVAMLGQAELVNADPASALSHYKESLKLLGGMHRPHDEAFGVAYVAQAELRAGNVERSLELGRDALARMTALQGGRDTLHPLSTLADAAIRSGDAEAAARWLDQAESVFQRFGSSASDRRQLSDLRSGDTARTPGQLAQDLAALRLRQAGTDRARREAALDAGLRSCGEWKGHALLDGLERERSGGDDAASARLLDERRRTLADRDAAVAELVAAASRSSAGATAAGASAADASPTSQNALREQIEALDVRAAQLGESLAKLSPREAAFEQSSAWGLAELRALLGPHDIYVEYAESMDRLYAYAVTTADANLVDVGSLKECSAQVQHYLAGLSDPAHLAGVAQIASDGGALYAALLGAVLPAGAADDARLIVVPSAVVSQLPFEALVVQAPAAPKSFGDMVFVLDRREVAYAPSGPVLAFMEQSGPRATPGRALVLGDPVYPPADGNVPRGTRDPRSLGFVRLPGTRDEALGVAQRLLDTRPGADTTALAAAGAASATRGSGGTRGVLLAPAPRAPLAGAEATDVSLDTPELSLRLGEQASASALRGDLRQYALIHCATHGHVDPQDPRLTGLALTPQGDDDGFVTLADVLDLSLDADLAVLSACETGLGRERHGEGTQSLARAFLHAGARSVVSSLWQVDDRETERTMLRFYEDLSGKKLSAPAALREARLSIRREPAAPDAFRGVGRGKLLEGVKAPGAAGAGRAELAGHPFFWAAFTYIGPPDFHPLSESAR